MLCFINVHPKNWTRFKEAFREMVVRHRLTVTVRQDDNRGFQAFVDEEYKVWTVEVGLSDPTLKQPSLYEVNLYMHETELSQETLEMLRWMKLMESFECQEDEDRERLGDGDSGHHQD